MSTSSESAPATMKAVACNTTGPVEVLRDVLLPRPKPGPRDLIVAVRAVSVNPVDTKVRAGTGPAKSNGEEKILGWDAAGTVVETGSEVTLFSPGDEVWYAGAINRQGSNAEFQAVDERIVGRKPRSLGFAEAAALPLTAITAWEMLFDRLRVRLGRPEDAGSILIVGGAGGVGSIAIQLARRLTGLTVIATASRPETQEWARAMGAHHVIDHLQPLGAQVKALIPGGVDHVLALTRSTDHFAEIVDALAPQGSLAIIDNLAPEADINKLKSKSLSLHWEFMFTRPVMQTADMGLQGRLLNEVSALVDAGVIRTTMHDHFGAVNAGNLQRAHTLSQSGSAVGKVVLEGF